MKPVYVLGSYSTPIKKWEDKSHKDLVREAYLNVVKDAGCDISDQIETIWSGSAMMNSWGQNMIRGQVVFTPLVMEKLIPERLPFYNVEGGCATGSLAFHGAWRDIQAGISNASLAMGFEKVCIPDNRELTFSQFQSGIDQMDPQEWMTLYSKMAEMTGGAFETGPNRSIFMDTYAIQARYHMWKYGTSQRQIAFAAAKNHCNASLNPDAQYRFRMTPDQVLEDRMVSYPLTRSMCAPLADGAAAAILCSEEFYHALPPTVQSRCIKIAACSLSSGKYRGFDDVSLSRIAADKAYKMAGVSPEDIDVAEVHDATAFGEIYQAEMMRFCPVGEGGRFIESGATKLDGQIPINTSGGLISKGHPIGATGLSMIFELVTQLRGEADERQVKEPEFALQENGGGVVGIEEACCSVVILQKT
ncbi:MAG: thiolase family protein [Desulfatitalea sp.]|nr:thiolase family protein [Desulfatitalea sp.]NNJ99642.1 thiolase family protein [Desulfatitalea sp.]